MADRYGHLRLLIVGCTLGTIVAALTAATFLTRTLSILMLIAVFTAAGLYVAVQEILEPTVTIELVSTDTLAIDYGALGTVNDVTNLLSGAGVGLLWTLISPVFGFASAALIMLIGTLSLCGRESYEGALGICITFLKVAGDRDRV